MIVFAKILPLQKHLDHLRSLELTLGFVPTMGALHEGHMSLIEAANNQCDITLCSIFVNPTQFNEQKDLENYPITIESDLNQLVRNDCDVVFLPSVDEIYPEGKEYNMPYDLGSLAEVLEGANRPGHFEGVVQVVDRLLNIVGPDKLFMGQKDFQQFSIIQRLLELKRSSTQLIVCPIKRDPDGLAMSSRNVRLNKEERRTALCLNQALRHIQKGFGKESVANLISEAKDLLNSSDIRLEYLEVVNRNTLLPLNTDDHEAVVLVAAWVGNVRLIDNMLLG